MINDSYIAGLFDGEGSVGVYAIHTNGRRKNADGWWSVKMAITGTYRPMIEAVYNYFGLGHFSTQKRQSLQRTPRGDYGEGAKLCRQSWRWGATSRKDCKYVLERILPYLIEKKEQAKIAIDFIDGKIEGREASRLCTEAKKFNFSNAGFIEPARRNGAMKGGNHVLSKLSDEQVAEARRKYREGRMAQITLAREYGVSQTLMHRCLKELTYNP